MSEKYPEYRESVPITPAAAPLGAHEATKGFQAALKQYSSMTAQYASDIAHDKAVEAGFEAGKTPGRKLPTAIFKNDKAFNEAYRQQSSMVLASEYDTSMNNVLYEFGKNPNPTGEDLAQYKDTTSEIKNNLLAQADPKSKRKMQLLFDQKQNSDMLQFAEKVDKADAARLKDNFNTSIRNKAVNVYDFFANDQVDAAQNTNFLIHEDIDGALANGTISSDEADKLKHATEMNFYAAHHEAEMMKAYDKDGELGAANYLQKIAKDGDADTQALLPQLAARHAKTIQSAGWKDILNLQNANIELAKSSSGILSPSRMEYYKNNLSERGYNKLLLASGRNNKKHNETIDWFNFALLNNDSVSLSEIPGKARNDIRNQVIKKFTEEYGREPSLAEDMTLLSGAFQMAIPDLTTKLNASLESDNPEVRANASQLTIASEESNRALVSKVSEQNKLLAKDIDGFLRSQHTAEEASNMADKMRVDKGTQKRLGKFNEAMQKDAYDLNTIENQERHIAEQFGLSVGDKYDYDEPSILPANASIDYMNALKFAFMENGKMDFEYANAQMIRAGYKVTYQNGFKQFMKGAVDNYVPLKFAKDEMQEECTRLVDNINKAAKNPRIPIQFGYEFTRQYSPTEKVAKAGVKVGSFLPGAPANFELNLAEDSILSPSDATRQITANRIDKHGDKVPGKFVFEYDNRSGYVVPGRIPSYGIYFIEDDTGVSHEITNVITKKGKISMTQARFNISPEARDELYSEPAQLKRLTEDYAISKAIAMNKINNMDWWNPLKYAKKGLLTFHPETMVKKSKKLKEAQKEMEEKEKEIR